MHSFLSLLSLCLFMGICLQVCSSTEPETYINDTIPEEEPLKIVSLQYDYVAQPLILTSFLIIVGLVMIGKSIHVHV